MFGRVFSRRVLSSSSSRAAYSRSTRVRGGHDHGHGHGHHAPAGPYDAPHHATYPNEAYLFGINPKVPYENQGWEWVTLITYIVGAGILITGATTKPLDSFKIWARNEALAREKVLENGGELEFGKFYSSGSTAFVEDEIDTVPKEAEE